MNTSFFKASAAAACLLVVTAIPSAYAQDSAQSVSGTDTIANPVASPEETPVESEELSPAPTTDSVAIPDASAQITQSRPDLKIKFGTISQTPTVLGEAKKGKVNLVVTNGGTALYQGPLNLNIYASTDTVLDKNPLDTPRIITKISTNSFGFTSTSPLQGTDELLGTLRLSNVKLTPGQSQTVTVDFTSSDFRNPSVVAPGAYYLFTEIDPKTTLPEATNNNKVATKFISTGDPVIVWNATLLNAIEASGKNGAGGTPVPLAARDQAIVHAAIYDSVNAINRNHKSLYVNFDASDPRVVGASPEAAAIEAAYTTLVSLFAANQKATFDKQLSRSLAQIPNGAAKDRGIALGKDVANKILDLRKDDGANKAVIPFPDGTKPGEWRRTPPDFGQPVLPGWGSVTPFSPPQVVPPRNPQDPKGRLAMFGLNGPPAFGSSTFVDQENFVRQNGGFLNTAVTTIVRTDDQTQSALFWDLDRPDTFRPPGQWNEIAEQLALHKSNTLEQNALLFAQLNIAEADAGILTWDSKYTYDQLRPITAIRQELPIDNSGVVRDPDWKPLLSYIQPEKYPNFPLTPQFPDYNSGHAAFAGAAGQVLINFFGDNTPFSAPSQDLPGVARSYNTIKAAIDDAAASRIYGGVHVPSSAITGQARRATPSIAATANEGIDNTSLQSSSDEGVVLGSLVGNIATKTLP